MCSSSSFRFPKKVDEMSKVLSILRLVVLIALPLLVCPSGVVVGDEGPPKSTPARGRSQQRVVVHTADSLEKVRDRVKEKSAVLIDVREQKEWDAGHLKNAVFIPLSKLTEPTLEPELKARLTKLSKDKVLYCHCAAGGRVLKAAPILKSLGYDARPLKAGYDTLLEAGFEKAPPPKEPSE
jgi:rhodanese-related sulfurtransferase